MKKFALVALTLFALTLAGFAFLYFVVAAQPPRPVTGLETFFEPTGHCPDTAMTRLARIRLIVPIIPLGPASLDIIRVGEEVCRQQALMKMLTTQSQLACPSGESPFRCFKNSWAAVQSRAPFGLTGVVLMLKDGVQLVNASNADMVEKQFQLAELTLVLMEFTHAMAVDPTQLKQATTRLRTLYTTHAELEGFFKYLEKSVQGAQLERLNELKGRSKKIAEHYKLFSISYDAAEQKLKLELRQSAPNPKD